jgi:LDH2 family malate/lactate/ureidoglycolate dehydrogenase
MKVVMAEELRCLLVEIFQNRGVPEADSLLVAKALVHANLRGVDSHGVIRVSHYVKRLKAGSINPKPKFKVEKTGPVTAYLEGDDGLGHVAVWTAMNNAIDMAKGSGLALVGIRKSSHCGALSFYTYQAIEADMIGMAITQTDSGVVPFGGIKPFFGTNPLCVGIPSRRGTPIVLDMATSTVSGGHVYKARAENRPIPSTWALDKEGRPTTDPHQAAYWTPAGGAKGFGLGVIIDVLTGLLMGGNFGPHVALMYGDYEKKRDLCHLVGAIDYHRFPGRSSFLDRVTQMIEEVHQAPTAGGLDRVMVPGEPEYLKEKDRMKNGIPLEDYLLDELQRLRDV